jgi:hypothetical protein
VLGRTSGHEKGIITAAKRLETHQIWALVPPFPATALCSGLCQFLDAPLRDCGAQDILGFLISWSAVHGRDGRARKRTYIRVDVARVVPILSADMGTYARQSLQERERGRRGHGGCEKVACD